MKAPPNVRGALEFLRPERAPDDVWGELSTAARAAVRRLARLIPSDAAWRCRRVHAQGCQALDLVVELLAGEGVK